MSIRVMNLCFILLFVAAARGLAQPDLTIVVPKSDSTIAVRIVEYPVPRADFPVTAVVSLVGSNGRDIILGQIGPPKLDSKAPDDCNILTFVVPPSSAAQSLELTLRAENGKPNLFAWTEHESKYRELRLGNRPVLRYMCEPLDRSSPERIDETYKAYHHLFDPRGADVVTKGPGGLYPHHRGLSYGFNRISYGDKQADVWHCKDGEFQAHVKVVSEDVGAIYGRHQVQIDWHGQDGAVFASEIREMTAYNVASPLTLPSPPEAGGEGTSQVACAGILIEFRSRLTTTQPKVRLDGEPQHAGFQFRAAQYVPDKTAKLTYYLRPDGNDEPGNFRNWSNQPNETEINLKHFDLPWNALSFVLADDKRLTCCYLDHHDNPKPARFSERDYGRFGSYFEYELTPDKPLDLQYRIWLQDGEMSVEQATSLSRDFNEPVEATLALK